MRQVNRTCWLPLVIAAAAILVAQTVVSAEARRVKRQQPSRNPFTTYFPPNSKFGNSQPTLPSVPSSASPFLNSSPFSTIGSTSIRNTFRGQSINELTTAPIRVTRPQQQNNNLPPPLEARKPNRSRDFYACLSNCLTLSHYNPVCGTDHTTYHNIYKLECANRCGARPRVQIRKPGIC